MTSDGTNWPLTWTSVEVRALLSVRRDSYESLGETVGACSETVRRWASGEQRPGHKELLRALDSILATLEPWQRSWFDELRGRTASDLAGWVVSDRETIQTRRDEFLRAVAALAALVPVETVERVAHHHQRPVDSGLVAAHADLADALALADPTARADVLAAPVTAYADAVVALLDRPATDADRWQLTATAVGSSAQAGLLALRIGERPAARRWFALSRLIAQDAGDDTMAAQALAIASMLYSPLPSGGREGDSRRAVALMQAASEHARGADPQTVTWVEWWLAMELAAAGDERGFREAVQVAERASGRSVQQDGRGFFARYFGPPTPQETAGNLGAGLVLLGHADEAVDSLGDALVPEWPRWNVARLADLAAARMLQGEPERACETLSRALDLALEAGYAMGVQRSRGVRASFPSTWSDLPCVRDLDDQLR